MASEEDVEAKVFPVVKVIRVNQDPQDLSDLRVKTVLRDQEVQPVRQDLLVCLEKMASEDNLAKEVHLVKMDPQVQLVSLVSLVHPALLEKVGQLAKLALQGLKVRHVTKLIFHD